jgi:RNA polymerase sigma-70 factor (ECF subfamily)
MNEQTTELQRCIDRMLAGDESYRQLLVDHAFERLRLLARKLLSKYPGVHRWEQTDDVLQNAAVRLWKSLEEVKPTDVRSFFGLAATQIRRELLDLARHHFGPCGHGRKHATNDASACDAPAVLEKPDPTSDPVTLTEWTELHEKAQQLPEEEREVFDLLYYHGLTQPEASDVLGISLRTLKRRWLRARESIYEAFHGCQPGRA